MFQSLWSLGDLHLHLRKERSDVEVVSHYLQAMDNLSQGQSALITADVSGFGQPEYFVQMGLIQAVEACWDDRKSIIKRAQASRSMGREEGWGSPLRLPEFVFPSISPHFTLDAESLVSFQTPWPSAPVCFPGSFPDCFHLYPRVQRPASALPCGTWSCAASALCRWSKEFTIHFLTELDWLRLYRPLFSVSQDQAFHF